MPPDPEWYDETGVLDPVPLSVDGDRLWIGFVVVVVADGGVDAAMNLGDDVDVRRWWCDGSVLYALDGSEIDELGFEPFLRLPTMCEARLDPESEEKNKQILLRSLNCSMVT